MRPPAVVATRLVRNPGLFAAVVAAVVLVLCPFVGQSTASAATTTTRTSEAASVSCPTDSFCVAAGSDQVATQVEGQPATYVRRPWVDVRTNGVWSRAVLPPAPSDTARIGDVSCVSSAYCLATVVDEAGNKRATGSLYEYAGGQWAAVALPVGSCSDYCTEPDLVTCVGVQKCVVLAEPAFDQQAVLRWSHHTWRSTRLALGRQGYVADMSCSTVRTCAFVGGYYVPADRLSLQERPLVGNLVGNRVEQRRLRGFGGLAAVACSGRDRCVATGDQTRRVVTFDRRSVTIGKYPHGVNAHADDISCPSRSWCIAVGSRNNLAYPTALTLTRKGWTQVKGIDPSIDVLSAVSCPPRSRACVAVGVHQAPSALYPNDDRAVSVTWDGKAWVADASLHDVQ